MPKIPWTPPDRPPRNRTVYVPPAGPPAAPCVTCEGDGVLYKNGDKGGADTIEVECWTCKGSGTTIPAPVAVLPKSTTLCSRCKGTGRDSARIREDAQSMGLCWVCGGSGLELPDPVAPDDPFKGIDFKSLGFQKPGYVYPPK